MVEQVDELIPAPEEGDSAVPSDVDVAWEQGIGKDDPEPPNDEPEDEMAAIQPADPRLHALPVGGM